MASYLIGSKLYRKTGIALLHPLIVSIAIIIFVLKILGINYETFRQGSEFINFLLGPSVVALGYTLYDQIEQIKGKVISVLSAITVGGIVGIVSVILICQGMGVEDRITSSLQPKSVTIPIAITLSEHSNRIPAMSAIIINAVFPMNQINETGNTAAKISMPVNSCIYNCNSCLHTTPHFRAALS